MDFFNPNPAISTRILATDLDGTLIPLPDNADNSSALERIRNASDSRRIGLVFATGRHLESVLDAIPQHALPRPDWIVCDVGTSIYRREPDRFSRFAPFESMLAEQTRGADRADVESLLADVDGLALQSAERQQRFKISYVCDGGDIERLAALIDQRLSDAQLPFTCLGSVDPFDGQGLLDILPAGASKAAALIWLATHADFTPNEVVFAGDSGNDLAALTCGFRAIVVANAAEGLAERVERHLLERGLSNRCFRSTLPATSGVLEGCIHFGLFPAP